MPERHLSRLVAIFLAEVAPKVWAVQILAGDGDVEWWSDHS